MDKIAVISDIHGNIPAFEAVLADIRARGITRVFCLGDLVGKGPHPEKAVDICREVCEVVVLGNWDDVLASDREFAGLPALGWHRERLGGERRDYLRNLPPVHDFVLGGRKIRLLHASHIGIYHRVHMNAPEEEHLAMFTNTDFTGNGFVPDMVGYGDIHRVYYKTFRGGDVLFNAGSVGNPLDEPLAAYVILEGTGGSGKPGHFSVQMIRIPYDIDLAVRRAVDENMPEQQEWEDELRTGRYRRDPASRAWREPGAASTV